MTQGYLIFHLNLAFSSIPTGARAEVIRKCYWPLLDLIEDTGIPIGIELTGWTLQQISELDPAWVERFRYLLAAHRCELIGSGWSQLIGPLVPYEVNCSNQKMGLEAYRKVLGVSPRIVLVNEMAFSTGMVDVYTKAGYEGIVMDRDNVRLALGLNYTPISATPTHAMGFGDVSIPMLWSDSIFFQRLQRVVHGDIPVSEYMKYVKQRAESDNVVLPLYCNDAEIFDYRPGRFTTESRLHPEGEWVRLKRVCNRLQEDLKLDWVSPGEALDIQSATPNPNIMRLTSVSQPIPVKKQTKYNINRWAVTGRDDLWLNSSCHRVYQSLMKNEEECVDTWKELCELWASDLRTHITDDRWKNSLSRLSKLTHQLQDKQITGSKKNQHVQNKTDLSEDIHLEKDDEDIYWTIKTPNIHLVLNARRGLTIKSLSFKSQNFEPLIGTLSQGYFNSIELGADFYSGGVIIEMPGERIRVTDLEWVKPVIEQLDSQIIIKANIYVGHGTIRKTIVIDNQAEQIKLGYDFEEWERPLGIVRVGNLTLMPDSYSQPINLHCTNGGQMTEPFRLDKNVNHGRAASTFVSSTAALGATDGKVKIKDSNSLGFVVEWDPAICAAVPMLHYQSSRDSYLARIYFSLCELDDTSSSGGRLLPFSMNLRPL